MPIISDNLQAQRPIVNIPGSTNGGRPAWPAQVIASGSPGALWQVLRKADLIAGTSQLKKWFWKNNNTEDLPLEYPRLYLFDVINALTSPYEVSFFYIGTQDDIEGDYTYPSPQDKFGVGRLVNPVEVGEQTFVVDFFSAELVPGGNNPVIQADYEITLDSRGFYGDTGDLEDLVIDNPGIVGTSGTQVTFSTTAGCANAYAAGTKLQTRPSSLANMVASIGTVDKTGINDATFDEVAVVAYNLGSIRQDLTLTILAGTTTYSVVSDFAGVTLASGQIGVDYEPENSDTLSQFIKIPAGTFAGTLAVGDTVIVPVMAAVISLWQRLIVPAGSQASSSKEITAACGGESA